ncbi:macro domain-containing protein [Candidatus Parabeggiatoa sp. HSG14]|uniref:macro domain-containing protein n=1 Tax=Candidatus Parabeggiatoa sp. HSG14 TaxID=3055593 RepID=UPI0025A70C54|nr:macro domain-containing protein [Thiotrichales bacterium HSG14]
METTQFTKPYGKDRFFIVSNRDILAAPVDVIVNPANSGLSHGGGLAEKILLEAGEKLEEESNKIIKEKRKIPVTEAVVTTAGRLPYKGVIHAVGPCMGDGKEQLKIEKTILNCLQIADNYKWESIAFPAISTGIFSVPHKICATAFDKAVLSYWKNFSNNSSVKKIWLCLLKDDYSIFEKILNSDMRNKKQEEQIENYDRDIPVYTLTEKEIEQIEQDDSDLIF